MVNDLSTIILPYFGLISDSYIAEFIQQLERFLNAKGRILTTSVTSNYATNRLAANIGYNYTDSQTGMLDAVYAAAWNKLREVSSQDTELRYLPPRFNGFERIDHVFDLLIIAYSDCLYQLLVQNISADLLKRSPFCNDGELDNYYSNSRSIFITYTFNATYGCPNPGPLQAYMYASCGAVYPNNCTTTTPTTTTPNPALYTKSALRVAVVLADSFAMRNPSASEGYSGYSVDLVKQVGEQLQASLSFAEVSLPNLGSTNGLDNADFTINDLKCGSQYECQWDLLVYNVFENRNSADVIIGLIPLTNAFADETISIGFIGGEIQTGINILIRSTKYA